MENYSITKKDPALNISLNKSTSSSNRSISIKTQFKYQT